MLEKFRKNGTLLLIAIIILATIVQVNLAEVYADCAVPSGYTAVRTKDDLDKVRNNPKGNFILLNDIVFDAKDFEQGGKFYNGGSCWLPIGDEWNSAFAGTFDGNNHKIINMKIRTNESSYYGFIGENLGNVKNVIFENLDVNVTSGGSFGIVNTNRGSIENVSSTKGKIVFKKDGAVGGITGYNFLYSSNIGTIRNCYNASSISAAEARYTGGITGQNRGKIESCYNTGSIKSKSASPGGIAGNTSSFAKGDGDLGGDCGRVKNCFNTGKVSGASPAGIAAFTNDREDGTSNIVSCYNVGLIDSAGVPICNNGKIAPKYCYYLDNQKYTSKVKGSKKTLKQLRLKTTFKGFDFDSTWKMDSTSKYGLPVLRNVKNSGLTVTNKKVLSTMKLKAPKLIGYIGKMNGKKSHILKFTKVDGATGYQLYFSFSGKANTWRKLQGFKSHPKQFTLSWNQGEKCYYKVRAYKKVGSKYTYSPFSAVKMLK